PGLACAAPAHMPTAESRPPTLPPTAPQPRRGSSRQPDPANTYRWNVPRCARSIQATVALEIGRQCAQDELDLKRSEPSVFAENLRHQPGDMRRGKAVASSSDPASALPGHSHVDARGTELDRWIRVVI